MFTPNLITNLKAGKVEVRRTKRGIEFWAWNHQHIEFLHIGTVIGATYEKAARILEQPEPSLCLSYSEFGAVRDASGEFIRFILDRSRTYAISVSDFEYHAEQLYNPSYGPQLRVALHHFVFSNTTVKRNAHLDNPRVWTQPALWGKP